jgi:hypothetical protein
MPIVNKLRFRGNPKVIDPGWIPVSHSPQLQHSHKFTELLIDTLCDTHIALTRYQNLDRDGAAERPERKLASRRA